MDVDEGAFIDALSEHFVALTGGAPSQSQLDAWHAEHTVMRDAITELGSIAESWNLVFEYELPFEGGRRPDVVVLAGESLAVARVQGFPT